MKKPEHGDTVLRLEGYKWVKVGTVYGYEMTDDLCNYIDKDGRKQICNFGLLGDCYIEKKEKNG